MMTTVAIERTEVKKLPLRVNYSASLKKLAKAGRYVYTDPNITAANYPCKKKGRAKLTAVLVTFGKFSTIEHVLEELESMDLRPGNAHELFEFGIQHPNEQLKEPIVALGSVWHISPNRYALCLYSDIGGRKARLSVVGNYWGELCRFLAFPRYTIVGE